VTVTTLDHLSHSQVQSFAICPRKWHYEKVEHAPKERIGSALIFGCAVHDTLAAVNESTLHGDRVDAGSLFLTTWKTTVEQADAPVYFGKDSADDLFGKGTALVRAYVPPSGIIGVEQPITVDLPDLPSISGRIDLIRRDDDGNLVLADLKTSGTKMLGDTHAVEAQLGLYDIAYPAAKHEVIVLGKLKTPTINVQSIVPWSFGKVHQHFSEVHHAMVNGVRYANRGWQCDGCSFLNRCQRDHS